MLNQTNCYLNRMSIAHSFIIFTVYSWVCLWGLSHGLRGLISPFFTLSAHVSVLPSLVSVCRPSSDCCPSSDRLLSTPEIVLFPTFARSYQMICFAMDDLQSMFGFSGSFLFKPLFVFCFFFALGIVLHWELRTMREGVVVFSVG